MARTRPADIVERLLSRMPNFSDMLDAAETIKELRQERDAALAKLAAVTPPPPPVLESLPCPPTCQTC